MTVRTIGLFLLCCVLVLVFGCGKTAEEKEREKAMKQAEQLVERMAEASKKMAEQQKGAGRTLPEAVTAMREATSGGKKIEPVDFRALKALLPESLPEMKRDSATGERSGAMGITVSTAEAAYSSEGGDSINITISDMGSMVGSPMMLGASAWIAAKIDRETESGYEKTTTVSGYPAFEQYDNEDRHGKLQVIVADRFMVDAEGSGVKMDAIRAALGKIDLSKLEKMKDQGAGK